MFQNELDVDETLSQLLVAEGFTSLEEVAYVPVEEIAQIEGLDEDIATELQSRAAEALERREAASREERRGLGVSDALAEIPHLTEADAGHAGQGGHQDSRRPRRPRDRRADPEEARRAAPPREPSNRPEDKGGILADYGLTEEQGNEIIMAARAHWFEDEEPPRPKTEEAADADPSRGNDTADSLELERARPRTDVHPHPPQGDQGRADPPGARARRDRRARRARPRSGPRRMDRRRREPSSTRRMPRASSRRRCSALQDRRRDRPRRPWRAHEPGAAPGGARPPRNGSSRRQSHQRLRPDRSRGAWRQGASAHPCRRCRRGRPQALDQAWRVGGGGPGSGPRG